MADLVSGRYGQYSPIFATHGVSNVVNPEVPGRTNAEYLGFSTLTDGALAATGVACFVPIPVDVGTVITNVSYIVGGTAASTPTHAFAAIYSGIATPALIAQSTDTTTAAIAASAATTYALTAATTITGAMAPNGFIYAGVSITASTIPTAAAISVPTAVGYQWFTSSTTPKGVGPLFLSATAGSSLNGTAAPTIASPAAKAVAPVLILS